MGLDTFTSGINTSFSTELNSNSQKSIVRRSAMTEDTTEYSAAIPQVRSFTDVGFSKTFTPPEGANSVLQGLKIVFDSKTNGSGEYVLWRVKITNDTNSAIAYATNQVYECVPDSGNQVGVSALTSRTSGTAYREISRYGGFIGTETVTGNSYGDVSGVDNYFEATRDGATYTVTLQACRYAYDDSPTAYAKDITITMYWSFLQDAVTEGWA